MAGAGFFRRNSLRNDLVHGQITRCMLEIITPVHLLSNGGKDLNLSLSLHGFLWHHFGTGQGEIDLFEFCQKNHFQLHNNSFYSDASI